MTRMERATATRALSLPQRLTWRREGSARIVLVLGAGAAGSSGARLRYRLPWRGVAGRVLGPDWMLCGQSLAQLARCAGVGNWLMFRPSSAMITWAVSRP